MEKENNVHHVVSMDELKELLKTLSAEGMKNPIIFVCDTIIVAENGSIVTVDSECVTSSVKNI